MKKEKIVENIEKKSSFKKLNTENIKQIVNQLFNSIGFPIIIGILLFMKTIFFYLNTISIRETIDMQTIWGTIAFLITIMITLCMLPNRTRGVTTMIIDIVLSMILFADNVYHTYSSSVLSVAQMLNLQYGEEIIDTLPMLLQLKEILYFIDIILIVILLCTKI